MGQFFDHIPQHLLEWARQQPIFWVASAPLSGDGHVNLSPKGCGLSYVSIEPNRMAYEDLSGSGVETIAHIRENGRVTVLFHAFEGAPRICRLYGAGSYHEYGSAEYEAYIPSEKRSTGSRAVIVIDIHKVGTSCGFGIPFYQYKGDRTTLHNWSYALEKDDARPGKSMHDWWRDQCSKSIDGLPALELALSKAGTPFKHTWVHHVAKPQGDDVVASSSGKPAQTGLQIGVLSRMENRFFAGILVGLTLATVALYIAKLVGYPL